MFLVASSTEQDAQFARPSWIVFPQPRQTVSLLGGGIGFGKDGTLFATRLFCCVNRLAGILRLGAVLQIAPDTDSTHRAISLPPHSAHSDHLGHERDIIE